MTDAGRSPDIGPSVCPFVALAADRDRRADGPDEGNRCYAERAPRQRDLLFQADFCYSPRFSSCAVFLAWAARNAAEPAYVSEAARKAWGSGIAAPEAEPNEAGEGALEPPPTPEDGLFGPPEPDAAPRSRSEQLDWISASAWAEVPWDERAELEAAEVEELDEDESDAETDDEADEPPAEEAMQAPKVPAAVPVRRRRKPQEPIRSRGSGEWHYADPPGHEPLVRRRSGITPPILLAVLGVLMAALVVFLIPTLFFSSGGGTAAASPSASPSHEPATTRQPTATAEPTGAPSPSADPAIRTYTVRPGDSLSAIAGRPNVGVEMRLLQCINRITNPNRIAVGQVLRIPPEGYACPPGWRRSTPEPFEE